MKIINWMGGLLVLTLSLHGQARDSARLTIDFEIPVIDAAPYHKPYVAIWLETLDRRPVHAFAFWAEQADWYKDLRQWWRKVGRKQARNYDAVSGATRKPGQYQIRWELSELTANLAAGDYVLHFEAVREQGSREYIKHKIRFDELDPQVYELEGKEEIGRIRIEIK